jgi:hypothetical protein
MRELFQAPWANQQVKPSVRFFAWIFVACAMFALGGMFYFTIKEGVGDVGYYLAAEIFVGIVGIAYMAGIFLHVAVKGKAPSGWLPWK